jgi:hypothetical protein
MWNMKRARYGRFLVFALLTGIITIIWFSCQTAFAQSTKADPAILDALGKARLYSNVDELVWEFFSALLISFAVILLLRLASGLRNGRFLRHLAGAYSLTAASHVGSVITAVFKDKFAVDGLISTDNATNAWSAILAVNAAWKEMDITLSFFSTFWLLLAWDLIAEYPKQGISKPFFTTATAILGLVMALLAVIVAAPIPSPVPGSHAYMVVQVVDGFSSAAALFLIGLAFCGVYPRSIGVSEEPQYRLLGFATGCFYMAWAVAEPLWYLLRDSLLFKVILLLLGLVSMLATVIFCSLALEEKSEFKTV